MSTADVMVTARMAREKKEAGNRILSELGKSPSEIINELYDYTIKNKSLPFPEPKSEPVTGKVLEEALDFIDSIPRRSASRYSMMTDDEIRRERLIDKDLSERTF